MSRSAFAQPFTVILTRPAGAAADRMAAALAAHFAPRGIEVLLAPVIELVEIPDGAQTGDKDEAPTLAGALDDLDRRGGWLVLPSPSAVDFLARRCEATRALFAQLAALRVAVVGPGSGAQLQSLLGRPPDFVPDEALGASLAQGLPAAPGTPVLVAGSRQTRPELLEGLRARGLAVQAWALYEPRPCAPGLAMVRERLSRGGRAFVVVASPSGVAALEGAGVFGLQSDVPPDWIAIGPTTARRLRACIPRPAPLAQAAGPTSEGLIAAIESSIKNDA